MIPKDATVKSENGLITITGPKGSKTFSLLMIKYFHATTNEKNEFNIKPIK